MEREYDVVAAVGPSVQDCYEVSEDVIAKFRDSFEECHWQRVVLPKEEQREAGKYQLKYWKANELVLKEAGIPKDQIAVTNLCTHCNPNVFVPVGDRWRTRI